ncbi:zeta toxin family protein [Streptomyces durmitorensis]|uniref:UDP-N-acetylglucosamine kinase n=1 Tax=Streptomyces durmitorensis TaxID=319947 RepID=A0ABY4PKP3_9ACTN|nr:zeta toxin family protein [Streptomyces durmitorensis]UQT53628.1 zeta toxin family protein [Streptomyces durmitorensis]
MSCTGCRTDAQEVKRPTRPRYAGRSASDDGPGSDPSRTPRRRRNAAPQDRPVVVFVAGQPGAGKTRLANVLHLVLNGRGGAVTVDRDAGPAVDAHRTAAPTTDGPRTRRGSAHAPGRAALVASQPPRARLVPLCDPPPRPILPSPPLPRPRPRRREPASSRWLLPFGRQLLHAGRVRRHCRAGEPGDQMVQRAAARPAPLRHALVAGICSIVVHNNRHPSSHSLNGLEARRPPGCR